MLSITFWAVVLLLLIACANAGGLMLGHLHRRERELAIGSSLGATRGQLEFVPASADPRPTVLGLGAALAAAALNTKALRLELFGVTVTYCITMVSVVATLALVAMIASLGPAHRAAAIDPIQALPED